MCKQHLNAFSVMARSLEYFSLGQRASNVTGFLVDATLQPAERRLWAALRVQRAATAVAHAGPIKKCLAVVDQPARRREGLAGWTGVKVARFIERKIIPTEGPVLAFRLVDYRDVRCNLLVVDEPIEVRSRAVGGIGRQALGFEIEALLVEPPHHPRLRSESRRNDRITSSGSHQSLSQQNRHEADIPRCLLFDRFRGQS